jgi:translation elongation factor EF-4
VNGLVKIKKSNARQHNQKNIDDCRDALVGKVPDPKSQIEQIAIAFIYKIIYDMDKEAVEKFKVKPKNFCPPKKKLATQS